jgi:lipoate-protein ligase A
MLDTPAASGAFNMALDEALMDSVREGGRAVLRFYRWEPACLSLGRNQPAAGLYDREEIARRGLDVVRRPTGGRAVLHDRELTYAVVMEERALGTLRQAYAAINRALCAAVRDLAVPAVLQPRLASRAPAPSLAPCFRDPAEGEVVVGGRKLVGSAQYRQRGVLLQHGSLLLENDQGLLAGLRSGPPQPPEDEPAVLADYRRPLPSWAELTAAVAAAWSRELPASLAPEDPSPGELARAAELLDKYAGVAWTWHR